MIDALYLPPKPAIIRAAEPWEIRAHADMAAHGIPRHIRRAILAELKLIAGTRSRAIQQATLDDLAAYAGAPDLPKILAGGLLLNPYSFGAGAIVTTYNGLPGAGSTIASNSVTISVALGAGGVPIIVCFMWSNGSGGDGGTVGIATNVGGGSWTNRAQVIGTHGGTDAGVAIFSSATSNAGSNNLTFSATTLKGAACAASLSVPGATNFAYDTAIQVNSSDGQNATGNLNSATGGTIIACAANDGEAVSATVTWSGTSSITKDGDLVFETGNQRKGSVAHKDKATAGSAEAVTVNFSAGSYAMGMAAISVS